MTNLYRLLGVRRNASTATIRQAYRSLSKAAHPDAPGGSDEKFNALKLAADVLSDRERRRKYDEDGDARPKPPDNAFAAIAGGVTEVMEESIGQLLKAGHDPAKVDFRETMIAVAEAKIAKINKDRKTFADARKLTERLSKRWRKKATKGGEANVMTALLDDRLRRIDDTLVKAAAAEALYRKVVEFLDDYAFDAEVATTFTTRMFINTM